MDPQTTQAIADIVKSVTQASKGLDWIPIVTSILSPLLVGFVLSVLGYRLEMQKQRQLDSFAKRTQNLADKIDAQKFQIEKINSIELQNKIHSMEIAKSLYAKLYTLYWNRVDNDADFDRPFQEAKRYMYENSIYLENSTLDAFFMVLMQLVKLKIPESKLEIPNYFMNTENAMTNLKKVLLETYNLTGRITQLELPKD